MKKNKKIVVFLSILFLSIFFLVFFIEKNSLTYNFEKTNFYSECRYCLQNPTGSYGQNLRRKYYLTTDSKETIKRNLKEKEIKLNNSNSIKVCKDGNIVPFYKDLIEIIEDYYSVNFEYYQVDGYNTLPSLSKGVCDLSFGWTKTEEREDYAEFTKPVYLGESIVVSKNVEQKFMENLNKIIEEVVSINKVS